MLNKLFVRILLGLAAIVFALGLFSIFVVNLTNDVREEHYWHDILVPYYEYLVENPTLIESSSLPSGLSYSSFDSALYSRNQRLRLLADQLVMSISDHSLSAAKLIMLAQSVRDADREQRGVVTLLSEKNGNQVFGFIAWLLKSNLERILSELDVGDDGFYAAMDELQSKFSLQVKPVSDGESIKAAFVLEGLASFGYAKVESGDSVTLYLSVNTGEIYQAVLPNAYSPVSYLLVLFLALCAIFSIALLAFSFVRGFDQRIRIIETAASRISRGELEARVTSAGEGDAISRLGLSFNSMADHIQRLMYVQKEMIHAVSHELRTPVARIRFGVQMIEDCQTPESVQKQVKGIDGDIQELDELIDEILTYARLEQGGPILAFQQADVAAIVSQVIAEQSTGKPEINIVSEFKEGSDVWKESEIEIRYIHRSIQNLVGNAKRYANSKVKVVCSFDSETCRIDVEDDGPGIPEDQWESVFTPFSRLDDSRTRSSGGYGLGLSIVRRILYWHGGQAFLGRSSMGGAKFSLVWPRKQVS